MNQLTVPPTVNGSFPCLHLLSATWYLLPFENRRPHRCEVMSHCGLDPVSWVISDVGYPFAYPCCYVFFGKCLFWSFAHLNWVMLEFLIHFGYQPSSDTGFTLVSQHTGASDQTCGSQPPPCQGLGTRQSLWETGSPLRSHRIRGFQQIMGQMLMKVSWALAEMGWEIEALEFQTKSCYRSHPGWLQHEGK